MSSSIGDKIRQAWKISGLSQKEFALKLHMSLRNAQTLFEREDFSIQQLIEISKVLNTDFVKMYLDNYKQNNEYPINRSDEENSQVTQSLEDYISFSENRRKEVSVQISISGDVESIARHFSGLFMKIKSEAEQRGLHLV